MFKKKAKCIDGLYIIFYRLFSFEYISIDYTIYNERGDVLLSYVYAMIIKYDNKNKANETEDFQCFVRIEFFDFDL